MMSSLNSQQISGKVLSIQSHVVHGYVGNRAAVFPLQLLDFEVDFINSVQFSNHVAYEHLKGDRFNSHQLNELYEGLKLNGLNLTYTHLLTGYTGDESFLNKIADIVDDLKEKNPNLIYLCDPVLGDNGKWYVPEKLLDIFKERLLGKADIITPNFFEIEKIYGKPINNTEELFDAIRHCHECYGIAQVIVSSSVQTSTVANTNKKLNCFASSKDDDYIIKIEFDFLPGIFSGSGDTFAAMLLAWLTKLNGNLKEACERAISAMIHILKRTSKMADLTASKNVKMNSCELKLIQSKYDIINPEIVVKAELIEFKKTVKK